MNEELIADEVVKALYDEGVVGGLEYEPYVCISQLIPVLEAVLAEKALATRPVCADGPRITKDRGKWHIGNGRKRTFLESDDFKHDVRLYLDGDFGSTGERLEYCNEICAVLNHATATTEDGADTPAP